VRMESTCEFNTSDKSIYNNGNVPIAVYKIANLTPEQVWQNAQSVSPTTLLKNPYSCIGKLYKLTGSVYTAGVYGPIPRTSGQWGGALMMVENPDSPSDTATVNFIYNAEVEGIEGIAGKIRMTCAGYFAGTGVIVSEAEQVVEVVVIVGNVIRSSD